MEFSLSLCVCQFFFLGQIFGEKVRLVVMSFALSFFLLFLIKHVTGIQAQLELFNTLDSI